MDWKNVGVDIAKAAPLIGGLLGGPLGAAGGSLVTKIVSSALGVDESPDAVSAALAADPAAYEKLKEAEMTNKVEFQRLAITAQNNVLSAQSKDYETEVDDRKNARQRQIETHDSFPNYLAVAVTFGFFAALAMMCVWPIPEANKAVVYIMVGSLGTAWAAVMSYTYGSTRQASSQNAKITDFAVSPGTVTSAGPTIAAPVTINQQAPGAQADIYKGGS